MTDTTPPILKLNQYDLELRALEYFLRTQGFRYEAPERIFEQVPGHKERACVSVVIKELSKHDRYRRWIINNSDLGEKPAARQLHQAMLSFTYRAYPYLAGRDRPEPLEKPMHTTL